MSSILRLLLRGDFAAVRDWWTDADDVGYRDSGRQAEHAYLAAPRRFESGPVRRRLASSRPGVRPRSKPAGEKTRARR